MAAERAAGKTVVVAAGRGRDAARSTIA